MTPSLELAKLALVTSKDEEDDADTNKNGTDSSNSTDATLVEEALTAMPAEKSVMETKPILGKRERVDQVDDNDSSLTADASKPRESNAPPPLPPRRKQMHTDSVMMFGTSLQFCQ